MLRFRLFLCLALLVLGAVPASLAAPDDSPPTTRRISISSSGVEANAASDVAVISADGRVVAFASNATNLVPGDSNGATDVFVHERATGLTTRVSVSSAGVQGNLASDQPALSADGRFVAFRSYASNLVVRDTALCTDFDIYDERVSCADIFVHDRQTGQTVRVSVGPSGAQANGSSIRPAISADGRMVAFASVATNLVSGDTNGRPDIFVRDRASSTTHRVSVSSSGAQANSGSYTPALSADGRYVVFTTAASNLFPGDVNGFGIDVVLHDRQTQATTSIPAVVPPSGAAYFPAISGDGRFVAFSSVSPDLFPNDSNSAFDAFLYDRETGQLVCVSRGTAGEPGNGASSPVSLSADGRFVGFASRASNLIAGDSNGRSDIFRYDRLTGRLERVSLAATGDQGGGDSFTPSLSGDGQLIAFSSTATDLVADDANGVMDAFVHSAAGYTVEGQVVVGGAPAAGVSVSAAGRRALTGSDGRYAFTNLPAGPVTAVAARPGVTFEADAATLELPPDATADFSAASPYAAADFFLGAASAGSAGDVSFDAADILAREATGGWQLFFDASRVGITRNVAAIAFDGSDILFVFSANQSVAGVGTFTPWDIARFSPTALGAATAGRFTWALDGSTVGLTTSGEKIDALAVAPDGRLLVSTAGAAAVPGPGGAALKSQDEDVLAFAYGSWSLAFDGSTVSGLAAEDVNALDVDAAGNLYAAILGPFAVGGVSGDGKDVLVLSPQGATYAVSLLWDGSVAGFPAQLDAVEVAR